MQKQNIKIVFRFSSIEFLYFAFFACSTYLTVYLMEIGMDSSSIGLITSAGGILGMIFLPFWGTLSDRLGSGRTPFIFCMIITGIMFCLLPILYSAIASFTVLSIYIPIIFIFRQSTNSMMDGWIISQTTPRDIGYGVIRRWGSIGYSIISLILGVIIGQYLDTGFCFYLMPLLLIPLLALCHERKSNVDYAPSAPSGIFGDSGSKNYTALFRNFKFVAYWFFSLFLNIYLSVTLVFMAYILQYAGCDPSRVGTLTGFRAIMEIFSMTLCSRMIHKVKLSHMMLISGFLFAAEQLMYQFSCGFASLLFIMVFSGLAGGISYSIGPSYIYEIVPKSLNNTAQSLAAVSMCLISVIGASAGGFVIQKYGIITLTNGCGLLLVLVSVLFGCSLFLIPKSQREA